MLPNLVSMTFVLGDPIDAATLGDDILLSVLPTEGKLVYFSAVPLEDDTGLTVDIDDDGTAVVTAVAAADKDAVSTWSTTHFGGTNEPVVFAKGSELGVDLNAMAAGNFIVLTFWFLLGA